MTISNLEAYSRLSNATPGGSQTLSKMPSRFVEGVYPQVLANGHDGHVWDVEGREYIDLISGLGAVSVGYADKDINLAVWTQMCKGASFSLPTLKEAEVAERLCELVPHTDMWKFGKNGTDATVMVVRAARAMTGRMKILSLGYNGCADQFEAVGVRRAGIPADVLAPLIHKAFYNDIESFQCLRDNTFACVIMEPMVYEYPKLGFLEAVRELCTDTGTILIFDEVVTGGRFREFVAQSHFNVVPDFACLGKAIANGFPLSAVGGSRKSMSVFERDDFFASGTFGGETVSLAACLATVDKLQVSLADTIQKGQEIKDAFNKCFSGKATCDGYPTRLIFNFKEPNAKAIFMQEMCKRRILVGVANMVMANHTQKDINTITDAIKEIAENFETFKLEGKIPVLTLKQRN